MIIVPATGVIWSTVWSTIRPPTSATPLYPGIVYGPDLRLGYKNSKLAQQLQEVVSANLTVSIKAEVACTEHVSLRSRDSH